MKLALLLLALPVAATCASAASTPSAHTAPFSLQENKYVACVEVGWDPLGIQVNDQDLLVLKGHQIVTGINNGRTPAQQAALINSWTHNPEGANVVVNCATEVYLGFGPDSSWTSG
jgi:hypothetical protein